MDPLLPVNMPEVVIKAAADKSSQQRDWEKSEASRNISPMSSTLLTSHDETSLLKSEASRNISYMVVTLLTSHDETSLLKAEAP